MFAALFAACLLLALPDMMRWQPWFYLYTAAIGILAFVPQASPGSRTRGRVGLLEPLQIMRLLVASVYFYSGANKMNAAFFEERLAGFLSGMPTPLSEGPVAAALTYSAPALEMAAGLGLLVGRIPRPACGPPAGGLYQPLRTHGSDTRYRQHRRVAVERCHGRPGGHPFCGPG